MRQYTETEIKNALGEISKMSHYEMCRLWRFGGKEIYFRKDLPTGEAFKERLFSHFGGFTPQIIKLVDMATRIAFSTHFPARMGDLAGKPTYFQEKIWSGLQYTNPQEKTVLYNHYRAECRKLTGADWPNEWPNILWLYPPKTTTIRSNYDYWKSKEGKMIQPFIWAGKPRKSKQIPFCPEVRLKRVSRINMFGNKYEDAMSKDMYPRIFIEDSPLPLSEFNDFSRTDGFDSVKDFFLWFNEDFNGALLEWS